MSMSMLYTFKENSTSFRTVRLFNVYCYLLPKTKVIDSCRLKKKTINFIFSFRYDSSSHYLQFTIVFVGVVWLRPALSTLSWGVGRTDVCAH